MQILKYAAIAAISMMSLFTAKAQCTQTDALPTRPAAEKIVNEVKSVSAFTTATPVAQSASTASDIAEFGESVVKTALQYLGVRYRSGQSGPKGFDCSGFTSYVFKKANVALLRNSRSQFTQGTPVANTSELQKGDLVFFRGRGNRRSVGHVGIVTNVDPESGKFDFVHASSSGVKVSKSNEAYYSRRYMGARRIVE